MDVLCWEAVWAIENTEKFVQVHVGPISEYSWVAIVVAAVMMIRLAFIVRSV